MNCSVRIIRLKENWGLSRDITRENMIGILQAQRRGPRTEPETFVAEESLMSAPSDFAVQYVEEALYRALEDE